MAPLRALVSFVFYRCLLLALWAAPSPVPNIEGHLTDSSHRLGADARRLIDSRLDLVQQGSKVDLAVLIMAEPVESLRDMGTRCYDTWSIGKSWNGAGGLLIISSDLKDCCFITPSPDVPVPEAFKQSLEVGVRESLKALPLERALSGAIERISRQLWIKGPVPTVPPPYDPNPLDPWRGATTYLAGIGVVVVAACVSRGLRKWQ